MRGLSNTAAALLLLPLAHLTWGLPVPPDGTQARLGGVQQHASRGPSGTVVEHKLEDSLIRFKIPCQDCSDKEKSAIEDAVLSLQLLPSQTDLCSFDQSTSGLSFNGEPLIMGNITQNPLRRSRRGTSKFPFPVAGSDPEVTVHWENYCSCLEKDVNGNCADYEYVLVLELPKVGRKEHPGFTISYKQFKHPQWLRLSGFPDKDGASRFGHSLHWLSPKLSNFFGQATAAEHIRKQEEKGQAFFSSLHAHDELSDMTSNPTVPLADVVDWIMAPTSAVQPITTSISVRPTSTASAPSVHKTGRKSSSENEREAEPSPEAQPPPLDFKSRIGQLRGKAQGAAHHVLERLFSLPHCLSKGHSAKVATISVPSPSEAFRVSSADAHPAHSPLKTREADSDLAKPATDEHDPLLIAALVTSIGAFISILLSTFVLCLRCRDPRRRAERAARREERLNRKLFRKAVRRQRWNHFVQRFTRRNNAVVAIEAKADGEEALGASPGIDWNEWTEKRIATLSRSHQHTRSLRDELNAFRSAHRHVDGLVGAEEGRGYSGGESSGNEGCSSGGESAAESGPGAAPDRRRAKARRCACNRAAQRAFRARQQERAAGAAGGRRYSDAASEKTAPPPYEEFEVPVVDGLQYARPPPAVDATPDSSVVATSTRASLVDSDSEVEGGECGPQRAAAVAVLQKMEVTTELLAEQEL